MAEFNVIDEGIINAESSDVYEALLAEYSGKTNWWMPYVESRLIEGNNLSEPGALLDITVHGTMNIRFTTKTIETINGELWRSQYVGGAFRGEGIWKLETANVNTKLSYHWHVRPYGLLLQIISFIVNIPKRHSDVIKKGFAALNEYLKSQGTS